MKTEDLYDHKYDDKAKLQFQFWAIKNSEKYENFFNFKNWNLKIGDAINLLTKPYFL